MSEQIMVIPDVHGRKFWRCVCALPINSDTHIIFLGDYTDPHGNISQLEALQEFFDIVEFTRQNPNRITLLVGNHELHYYDKRYRCSGFAEEHFDEIHDILTARDTRHFFKLCRQVGNVLFSHAGVLKGWYDRHFEAFEWLGDTLEDRLNAYFTVDKASFDEASKARGGTADFGSPLWADMSEHLVETDPFDPQIDQIVGHTPLCAPTSNSRTTFIDCGRPYIILSDK